MKNFKLFLVCALALFAGRASAGDNIQKAMQDELSRTTNKLRMENMQKPYFAAFYVDKGTSVYASASFGSLISAGVNPYCYVKPEIRVGSRDFDNTHFQPGGFFSWSQNFTESGAIEEPSYDNIRFALWSASDQAYKQSLERLSQKKAYRESKNITELYDDLSEEKPVVFQKDNTAALADAAVWGENMKNVSAVFKKYPLIKDSKAFFYSTVQNGYYLNSEGSAYRKPESNSFVEITASAQAEDGFPVNVKYRIDVPDSKDLPAPAELQARAGEMARELSAMARSSTMDAYIGPVVFENGASAVFFEHFLANNISNPKEIWSDKNRSRKAGELTSRLGLRVIAPFLRVYDDPLAGEYKGKALAGSYEVDDEGVPAQRIEITQKGKLVNFYMSRACVKNHDKSNGHGRYAYGGQASGMPGNLFIVPDPQSPKTVSAAGLKKKLLALCKEQDLEYGILVKNLNGFYAPFEAYKLYTKDGSSQAVHGLEFTGFSLRALRDIAAASKSLKAYSFSSPVLHSVIAPSVLVSEMEIKKTEQKPDRLPYLKHPYFDRQEPAGAEK